MPDSQIDVINSSTVPAVALRRGSLRSDGEPLFIRAGDDLEAIRAWLMHIEMERTPSTYRGYRREIGRFMKWLTDEKRLSLSEALPEQYTEYRRMLLKPPPSWVEGKSRRPEDRRPMRGALSPASADYAMTVLKACLAWLVNAGYLKANPMGMVTRPSRNYRESSRDRYLTRRGLQALLAVLHEPWVIDSAGNETDLARVARHRTRAIVALMAGTALRRQEVAQTVGKDFKFEQILGGWRWSGLRKGGKAGNVAVPAEVMEAIGDYRQAMGLRRYPEPSDKEPVIRRTYNEGAICGKRIAELLDEALQRAALWLKERDPDDPARAESIHKLTHATPHWLRHTRITQLLQAGATLAQTAQFAGHAGGDVTARVYSHVWESQGAMPGFNDLNM